MRSILYKGVLLLFLFINSKATAQTLVEDLGNFLNDATWFSDKYITPATDASVYQAISNWVVTPKKKNFGEVTVSLHGNLFFVPNRDREFKISNSDFSFLEIEGATSTTVATALGNDTQYYLTGNLDGNAVRIETPRGINQETIFHPYLQASVALWKGTEIMGKYSTKIKLKRGDYQVYGFGVKHNLSQYLPYLEKNKFYIATLLGYSKEKVNFDFLDTQTAYGNLGINRISGLVDTYQFQVSASKQWNKFELMLSSISTYSKFKYQLTGERGTIEDFIPVQYILNEKLKDIYKSKFNSVGEISGRYAFYSKFYVQSSVAFGKFVNTNFSVQYEF